MIILRLPPFPIEISYDVTLPNTEYLFSIENVFQTLEEQVRLTSNAESKITYTLSGEFTKYDHDYSVSIYPLKSVSFVSGGAISQAKMIVNSVSGLTIGMNILSGTGLEKEITITNINTVTKEITFSDDFTIQASGSYSFIPQEGDEIFQDILTVIRPYVNPNTLGTTATEIAEATYNERLARTIIDSIIGRGFTFKKKVIEIVGQGTDYLPIWEIIYDVAEVWENGLKVYDKTQTPKYLGEFTYFVTKDRSSIVKVPVDDSWYEEKNRSEKKPLKYRSSNSDSFYAFAPYENYDNAWTNIKNTAVAFPEGFDYIVIYEDGYKVVPNDISDATKILIEDIKCGKMEHYKSYVLEYKTDQFGIVYTPSKFTGTGNILVDVIIDKYITNLKDPGFL